MPLDYSISGLGGLGLDASGAYSSYNPAFMGGMSSYGMSPYGISPYGGMGMMGMGMNPEYMTQYMKQMTDMQKYMAEAQHQQEKTQLTHSTDMHTALQQAEIANLSAHDRAIFQKAMVDGDVKEGVRNLSNVIRNGDQDAICQEFDKLKMTIFTKYSDYFQSSDSTKNTAANVNNLIRTLYAQIVSAELGQPADLENDIKTYGESAIGHGFNIGFLGKKGHNEKYTEETINYCFGTRINDKESKDRAVKIGEYAGKAAEVATAGAAGAAGGLATYGILKAFTPSFIGKFAQNHATRAVNAVSKMGRWGKLGLAAAIVGDILWQTSRA